jgi:endonuclease VIII
MPEGPSIVILKEQVQKFKGQKILAADGNTKKIDVPWFKNKTVKDFKSWGKHFLICFDDLAIRVHFLLFGSYLIDETKQAVPRLSLKFKNGTLNLYACSVLTLHQDLDEIYDWSGDVMNESWDEKKAYKKVKAREDAMVCDVLLDQFIFAGVGNIIKNEVLYRIKVHPASLIKDIPEKKIKEFIKQAVIYSFEFLKWKKEFTLKKHFLAHTKSICVRCNGPIRRKHLGKTNRRTFFCENCQKLYGK